MINKHFHIHKRWLAFGICTLFVLTTACQKTPTTSAVVNKEGQATLVQDNAAKDDGIPIRDRLSIPETVEHEIECNNNYTTIVINATVAVPDTSAIPVYAVRMKEIDEEYVQWWAENFFEEDKIRRAYAYGDEGYVESDYTVDELYTMIEGLNAILEEGVIEYASPEAKEEDQKRIRADIEMYTNMLATAPEERPYDTEVDYTFDEYATSIGYDADDGSVMSWEKTYPYISLSGEREGREYEMTVSKDSVNGTITIHMGGNELLYDDSIYYQHIQFSSANYRTTGNHCSLTYEESVALCDEFLEEMGIEHMKAKYSETAQATPMGSSDALMAYEDRGYIITYYRDYGMIGDCYTGGVQDVYKYEAFWYGGLQTYDFVYARMEDKFYLPEGHAIPALKEECSFLVSDDGILAMSYQCPMEDVELLAENVELLAFDRVLESAYAYLEVMYDEEGSQLLPKETRIGCIELNLARVQNPNAENDFTMIPVWDFRTGVSGKSVVTVNAIDGSIIDREAGH